MDQASLEALLKATGMNVAYHQFVTPPSPPYVVYLFTDSANFGADNKVYARADNYQVELYSVKNDVISEGKIESALDAAELFYEKSELYIETERLYQVVYTIQI